MKRTQEAEEKHFAEEMGLIIEQIGLPRMAGRILGWLLVSDAPYHTLNDLAEALQASKGSISTMTRLLIQVGMLERVALPGHRHDYFRIKYGNWAPLIKGRMSWITAFRETLDRGLELAKDKDASIQQPLQELRDLYAFIEREIPALYERWERERARSKR